MPEDDPLVIAKMIEYLYTSNYKSDTASEEEKKQGQGLSEMRLHAELYGVADKYNLPSLANFAKSSYIATTVNSWDPSDFLESIDTIYTSTPQSNRGLRNVAVTCTQDWGRPDFTEEKGLALMKRVCLQVPEHALDLVKTVKLRPIEGHCDKCGPGSRTQGIPKPVAVQ